MTDKKSIHAQLGNQLCVCVCPRYLPTWWYPQMAPMDSHTSVTELSPSTLPPVPSGHFRSADWTKFRIITNSLTLSFCIISFMQWNSCSICWTGTACHSREYQKVNLEPGLTKHPECRQQHSLNPSTSLLVSLPFSHRSYEIQLQSLIFFTAYPSFALPHTTVCWAKPSQIPCTSKQTPQDLPQSEASCLNSISPKIDILSFIFIKKHKDVWYLNP